MGRSLPSIADTLTNELGIRFEDGARRPVSGGSFSQAFEYRSARESVFVKVSNAAGAAETFQAEAAGLKALAAAEAVRVPLVVGVGRSAEGVYLALEWIVFGAPSRSAEATLGKQLAWQHRCTHEQYGWDRDNTIGATPQLNGRCGDWVAFFRDRRLRFQLERAAHGGADASIVERGLHLCDLIPAFFESYRPSPSLLHGDLWGGNWRCDEDGLPVIFDPAVYYGDRETDIAMTRLFGGFGPAFYTAYQSTWPLDAGAEQRTALYNLYHVLNHFNLFGGSYLAQAEALIDHSLAELGH